MIIVVADPTEIYLLAVWQRINNFMSSVIGKLDAIWVIPVVVSR